MTEEEIPDETGGPGARFALKLLSDANLSPKLVGRLADTGLARFTPDEQVWEVALPGPHEGSTPAANVPLKQDRNHVGIEEKDFHLTFLRKRDSGYEVL